MKKRQSRDFDICVGVITAVSGVKGYVKIRSFAEQPSDLAKFTDLFDEEGHAYNISQIITVKRDYVVARIEGIESRDQAEKLRNIKLHIKRSELPDINMEEYYHADLIGMQVTYEDGLPIGTVKNIVNFGAGDILEIYDTMSEKVIYYPFNKQFVPKVDLDIQKIIVTPLEEVVAASV